MQEKIKECFFCKQRESDYEWMFLEQKNISDGYREIIEELQKQIKELKIKKSI